MIFVTDTGETLKAASTPFAPEINPEDFDHLLNTPGKLSSKAASFIMKVMYGARMAMPQIRVIVFPARGPNHEVVRGQRPPAAARVRLLARER